MFWVTTGVQANRALTFEIEQQCNVCKGRWPALVLGVGEGRSDDDLRRETEAARARALSYATHEARSNAEMALSVARCPLCGERDPAAVRAFTRDAAVRNGAASVIAGSMIYWFFSESTDMASLAVVGAIVAALFVAAVTGAMSYKAWRALTRQVQSRLLPEARYSH